MKAVSAFLPRVIPYLMGCPEPLAARVVVDAAINFCDESLAIRQKLDPTTTVIAQSAYELDVPTGQQISRVMKVWVDNTLLYPAPSDDPIPVGTPNNKPSAFFTTRSGSEFLLNLFPAPDKAYSLMVEVALRPERDTEALEDDLYNLWLDIVVAGAVGRAMQMPGQAFSDPATGAAYSSTALQLARKARIEGAFGRVRSTQSVRPRALA